MWESTTLAPNRVGLTLSGHPFQLIVSAFRGQSETDDQVRELDEKSVGNFQVLSPMRKLRDADGYRVFAVTRKTPVSEITFWYHAGTGGLVVASIETPGPIDSTVMRSCDRVIECLSLKFPE